jgi:uncharacterized protein YjbJ (UPF0337 family)
VDFHAVLATTFIRATRYLEQNVDKAVTLETQQINNEDMAMDKDRIKGSAEQAEGAMKEAAGKVFGDKKLEAEGKTDKAAGKVQSAAAATRGKSTVETALAGLGWRIRTLGSREAARRAWLDRNGGAIGAPYSLQNGLDWGASHSLAAQPGIVSDR